MAVKSRRPRINGVVNRINLVGVELEGAWQQAPPGERIEADGSVKIPGTYSINDAVARLRPDQLESLARQGMLPSGQPFTRGEVVSKPLSIEKIERWITACYPQMVNETCGLHVHMSFLRHINYMRLMCKEFATQYIIEAVREWAAQEGLPKNHPQWNRLDPNHGWTLEHCAHLFLGDEQVKMKKKDYHSRGKAHSRYTFVNYCAGLHGAAKTGTGTVEVRGLSMPPKPDQAVRAVMAVINATNRWLSKVRQRELAEKVHVTARPEAEMRYGSYISNY